MVSPTKNSQFPMGPSPTPPKPKRWCDRSSEVLDGAHVGSSIGMRFSLLRPFCSTMGRGPVPRIVSSLVGQDAIVSRDNGFYHSLFQILTGVGASLITVFPTVESHDIWN
jgi:hypothetical protein